MRKIIIRTKSQFTFRFFTFDIETRGLNAKKLKFVGTWWEGTYRRFDTAEAFWEWTDTLPRKGVYGYAYNAIYDLSGLLQNPLFDLKGYIDRGGRFISGRYGHITFVDAQNLLHSIDGEGGLASVSACYGLKHVPLPASLRHGTNTAITEAEVARNVADCENLHIVLTKFFDFVAQYAAPRPLTLASNSLRIWQENFCPIAEPHSKGLQILVSDLDDRFRAAYFGGRTEVYWRGRQEGVQSYDVHSMYPHAMTLRFPVPSDLRHRTSKHLSQSEMQAIVETCEGMAEATVTIPPREGMAGFFGPLPIRLPEEDDRVFFPVGTFGGAWCFPELREALRQGAQVVFHSVTYAEEFCWPFKDFVQEFYAIRIQSEHVWEQFQTKLLMNALFGKMGQAGLPKFEYHRENPTKGWQPPLKWKGKSDGWEWVPFFFGEMDGAGFYFQDEQKASGYNSILSFAAYTTSYARVLHLKGLQACRGALYGDTDSVFSYEGFPAGFLGQGELGSWRQEATYDWTEFWTPKTYQAKLTDGTLIQHCKGVPREYVRKLFQSIETDTVDARGVQYKKVRTPKEAVLSWQEPGTPLSIFRHVNTTDDKRCWSGKGSRPHTYRINSDGRNQKVCC